MRLKLLQQGYGVACSACIADDPTASQLRADLAKPLLQCGRVLHNQHTQQTFFP